MTIKHSESAKISSSVEKWSDKKTTFLKDNYFFTPTILLAEYLGFTVEQVHTKASNLNLKKATGQTLLIIGGLECKLCSMCREVKTLDRFGLHEQSSTGLHSNCKKCRESQGLLEGKNRLIRLLEQEKNEQS